MRIRTVKFNFIMNAILTVSSILFPLITFPYISRVLLVEGSGKVAFATSVVSYFTMFATLGIPTYGIRECARVRDNKEELSRTVQELLIISGITTAITYGVFFLLLFVVPQFRGQKELLIVIGASIGLTTIGVQWFYSALEQYSYITVCAVLFKIIGLILMFLLVKKPEDYVIYGAVYVIGSFGSYVLNFLRLRRFVTFKKQGKYNLQRHRKGIITFFLLSVATSVYLNLDLVMLGFMKGDVEVGYYNAGIKVKTVLVTCVTSLGTVLLPRLSYYIQQEKKQEFQRMVTKAFQFVLIVSVPMMVYFILYAKESILFLAGESFLPATASMIILMPTVLFRVVQYNRNSNFDAFRKRESCGLFSDGRCYFRFFIKFDIDSKVWSGRGCVFNNNGRSSCIGSAVCLLKIANVGNDKEYSDLENSNWSYRSDCGRSYFR